MRRGQKRVSHMRQKCIKFPMGEPVNHFSWFLDAAIASLQENMSAHWLVGLSVSWPLASWSVGPTVMLGLQK